MSADQFRQAQDRYFVLKGQLSARRITKEQFEAAIKNLMLQDASGRYWMLGPDTGKWYVHDGKTWVEAQPPEAGVPAATPPTPAQAQPRQSSNLIFIAIGIVAVSCMLIAIAFFLVSFLGLGNTAQISPTVSRISAPASVMPTLTVTGGTTPVGGGIGRIAFATGHDGNDEIYVMNADGSQRVNLTNNPAADNRPAWSPDGSRIAFASNRDGHNEIYVMNANGSYPTRLTNHPAGNEYPAWSPDGTRIAFHSQRDGNWKIYVMNADGSNVTRLTNNLTEDSQPSWSPDGKRIAFTSKRDGNYEIYVMNADGTQQTRLTNNPAEDWFPAWSPDGARIAFVSGRDTNYEIYMMNTDGSQQTRLTTSAKRDLFASWSPDSTQIVFSSERDGTYQIYLMKPDGSQQTRISSNADWESWPAWQPREATADALKTLPVSAITPWPTFTPTATRTLTPTVAGMAPVTPAIVTPPTNILTATVAVMAPVTPAIVTSPTNTLTPGAPMTAIPPGLYVTAMGMDQAQPAHGQNVNFTASFLNTTSGNLSVRWKVYIYRADNPAKSTTESAIVTAAFPPGPSLEQNVPMNFRYGATGQECDYFFARVGTLDSNNKPTDLTTPNGPVFEKGFSVCK